MSCHQHRHRQPPRKVVGAKVVPLNRAGVRADVAADVDDDGRGSPTDPRRQTPKPPPLLCPDVEDAVVPIADMAAATLACRSTGQLPNSAASSSLGCAASTSATLVAEDGADETGVDAMTSKDVRGGKAGEKADGAEMLRSVGYI